MIHARDLIYDYIQKDEEGRVESVSRAIDDINVDVKPGEFIAVLGHNGSGKSTFAKHLNALLVPTGGTVLIDGKDTSDERNIWDIRKTTGMIFQNPDNQIIGQVVDEDVAAGIQYPEGTPAAGKLGTDRAVACAAAIEKLFAE